MEFWYILGIEPTKDEKTVKNAYRNKLKNCHPEDNPEGFKELRAAYDAAIAYCNQTEEAENSEIIEDDWVRRIHEIYSCYSKRINPDEWTELLNDEYATALDTSEEARDKLIVYMMSHHLVPSDVWKVIVGYYDIKANIKEFKERFPEDFLEYIINNSEYPDNFAYNMFEQDDDNLPYDEYIDRYYKLRGALGEHEVENAKNHISIMESMPLSHPYFRVAKMNFYIMTGELDRADELSEELYRDYYDDHNCRIARAFFYYHSSRYDEAMEIYNKLKDSKVTGYQARLGIADCLLDMERYKEAQTAYKDMLLEKHYDPYLHYKLSICNSKLLERYGAILKKNPDDLETRIELCWCYYQNNEIKQAYKLVKDMESEEPLGMDLAYLNARCLLGLYKYAKARKYLNRWMELFEGYRALESETGKKNREREELVYYFMAESYIRERKYVLAMEFNARAIACMSIDKDLIITQKGGILHKMGFMREAISTLEDSLKLSYDNIQTMILMGDCYRDMGYLSEAVNYYERAIYTYGPLPEIESRLCRIYINEGMLERAEEMVNDFKKRDYIAASHMFVEALLLYEKGEITEAVKLINQIKKQDIMDINCDLLSYTDLEDFMYESTVILYDGKQLSPEEAIKTMKKVVKACPDNVHYLYYLANICYRNMEDDNAIKYFKKALKLRPESRDICMALAACYRETGSKDEAKMLKRVLSMYPEDESANGRLGDYYDKRSEYEQALTYYSLQLDIEPSDYYYISRGIDYLELWGYDEAYDDFIKASELNPKNPYAYYNIGRLYMRKKQNKKAVKLLKKAISVAGSEKRQLFFLQLAKCYARLRDEIDNADALVREVFDKMEKAFPDDLSVPFNRAKTLRAMGYWQEAIEILEGMIGKPKAENYNPQQEIVLTILDQFLDREKADEYIKKYKKNMTIKQSSFALYYYAKYLGDIEDEYKYITYKEPAGIRELYDAAISCRKLAALKKGDVKDALLLKYRSYLEDADVQSDRLLKSAGDQISGLKRKAMIAIERDELQEAAEYLKQCETAPMCDYCYCSECYELYLTRAALNKKLGNKEQAMKDILKAAALCPDDGEIELVRREIEEM